MNDVHSTNNADILEIDEGILTELDKIIRKKILMYYKVFLEWGYKCSECKKLGIIQNVHSTDSCDYVNWSCKHCKKTWGHEFDDLAIRRVMNGS